MPSITGAELEHRGLCGVKYELPTLLRNLWPEQSVRQMLLCVANVQKWGSNWHTDNAEAIQYT